jgi:hypothetical protein
VNRNKKNKLVSVVIFLTSIVLIVLFVFYKLRLYTYDKIDLTSSSMILRLCITSFFISWVLGTPTDVRSNSDLFEKLEVEVKLEFRTVIIYLLMFIVFITICISENIILFCFSMISLVVLELINITYLDKKYVCSIIKNDKKTVDGIDRYQIAHHLHKLFVGRERTTRNIINIIFPGSIIIFYTIFYSSVGESKQYFILCLLLLVFILFSETWMVVIRLKFQKIIGR